MSRAMESDEVHSLSAVFATSITFWASSSLSGRRIGNPLWLRENEMRDVANLGSNPVGHWPERREGGLENIFSSGYEILTIPGTIVLVAVVVSVISKEGMFWYYGQGAEFPGFSDGRLGLIAQRFIETGRHFYE